MDNIKSDKGFTLIELMVSIFVLFLLFLVLSVLIKSGLSLSYNSIESQRQRVNELQNLFYIVREIQSAGNIVITNNKTLILYAVDGSSATNYVINNGYLEEYMTINNNIIGSKTKLFKVEPSSNFKKNDNLPDTVDINITIVNADANRKSIDFITSVSNRIGKSIEVK